MLTWLKTWLSFLTLHAVEPEAAAEPDANGEIASAVPDGASTGEEAPDPIAPSKDIVPAEMAAAISAGLKKEADKTADPEHEVKKPDAAAPDKIVPAKKPEEAKPKKADDFALTDDEKRVISVKGQARFQELTKFANEKEQEAAKYQVQVQELTRARNDIMGLLEQTQTGPEDLGQLLDYNHMLKSGRFEDALKVVESQRAIILKALGREAPGIDLLVEHPDLKARVDNLEIAREDAVALANARYREQTQRQYQTTQQQHQQRQVATQQQQDQALQQISQWAAEMQGKDLDYGKKEPKVTAMITDIVKQYPPNLWLDAVQRFYGAIEVIKEQPLPSRNNNPLRPNNTVPGHQTPNSMAEAISQGVRGKAMGLSH